MTDIWYWLGSLFNAQGHDLAATVLRWISVYLILLLAAYFVVGHVVDRRIRFWEGRARDAYASGKNREALQAYARAAFLALVFEPLYRGRWYADLARWNEPIGDIFYAVGKYASAVFFYTRAVDASIRGAGAWHFIGIPAALEPGAEAGSPHLLLYEKLGRALMRSGCVEEAIVWLRRASAAAAKLHPDVWLTLAEAYESLGNMDMAAECRRQAGGATEEDGNASL